MDIFVVQGGQKLKGSITVGGAKNAAVAIIPAAILSGDICRIENLPTISDVEVISKILVQLGAKVKRISSSVIEIDSRELNSTQVSQELARNMRASYYMLGALLGRFGHARVPMPGGCYFGVRPIDQHLKGFDALGAKTGLRDGIISLTAKDGLKGACVPLDVVSVGATINIMLAAVRAKGLTVIEHAAKEPHIVDLANFLNSMGADVRGAGTDVIKIRGVSKMHGATYSIIPDQIEAGTYMIAAAATGGDITIKNVTPKHMESISKKLMEMGVEIYEYDDSMRITRSGPLKACNVTTMPHPGFPTDMQPQMAAAMSIAKGVSSITEGVWENRFQYVEELKKLGVNAEVQGRVAKFTGVEKLIGNHVKATDLRGGAAMVIAALIAEGETYIREIYHIERGYEQLIDKLVGVGAVIDRRTVPDDFYSEKTGKPDGCNADCGCN